MDTIQGFSKLTPDEKLDILRKTDLISQKDVDDILSFYHADPEIHHLIEKFTENVIGAFHLPYSIAPNFLINQKLYHIPMVIEESSVVAAASWSARFWADKGGFTTSVLSEEKIGQIYFTWTGAFSNLQDRLSDLNHEMIRSAANITEHMEKRGGGIKKLEWIAPQDSLPEVFQCRISFLTADSMGANFINSSLETMSAELVRYLTFHYPETRPPEIVLSILSNYTPNCLTECRLETDVQSFRQIKGVTDAMNFARKFKLAVDIASTDPYRAVTHNKGIFNGMDAVVLATANDFRAFEAGGHAFAAKDGKYTSLTQCYLEKNYFTYVLQVPVAVGSVGGLTSTHPLAKLSLKILQYPSARELMQIIAATGMANNFSAIKALTTTGIQSGHMKMHLSKILLQLNATPKETKTATDYFEGKTISYRAVANYIQRLRSPTP